MALTSTYEQLLHMWVHIIAGPWMEQAHATIQNSLSDSTYSTGDNGIHLGAPWDLLSHISWIIHKL